MLNVQQGAFEAFVATCKALKALKPWIANDISDLAALILDTEAGFVHLLVCQSVAFQTLGATIRTPSEEDREMFKEFVKGMKDSKDYAERRLELLFPISLSDVSRSSLKTGLNGIYSARDSVGVVEAGFAYLRAIKSYLHCVAMKQIPSKRCTSTKANMMEDVFREVAETHLKTVFDLLIDSHPLRLSCDGYQTMNLARATVAPGPSACLDRLAESIDELVKKSAAETFSSPDVFFLMSAEAPRKIRFTDAIIADA